MTASRADRAGNAPAPHRRRATPVATLIVALTTVLSAAAPLAAQQPGPPIRLVPTVPGADQPPPEPPLPSADPKPAPTNPAPTNPIVPRPPPVRAEALAAADPDGDGVLDDRGGGLGIGLWRGLPRAELLRLLAALPPATPSPAARDLTRRLLLTAAAGPQPAPGEPPPPRRFAALKVEALARLGDPAAALRLAAVLPDALKDDAAARAVVDAQLLQDALDCPKALALGTGFTDPYWKRLEVFCRARAGERSEALVALGALRAGGERDDAFLLLAEAMAGGTVPAVRVVKDPTPLSLAMLRALNLPVPPEAVAVDEPARLAAVARNAATDPVTRVGAAERAAGMLFLDARALAEAYQAAPARGDELLRLRDLAARDRGPRVRGLVQQAFAGAMDGNRRMALAALALDLLDPPMLAGPAGAVVAAMLDSVTPNAQAAHLAPAAARLYTAQAREDAARRWLDLAGRTGGAARLWPLAAQWAGHWAGPAGLQPWLDEALRTGDPAARARASGILALVQAQGVAVPEDAWLAAADGGAPAGAGPAPDPALWARLKTAAAEGRTGETVLVSLALIGKLGPAGTAPVVMARIVAALRTVGLESEARALAREAVAAALG
ncbi:hypothetical protein [Azospirillum sp.]|uniref:hypothetical protein n=1 Tax=Azospirillum sp. TaxID=34012 RepID=UPI002D53E4E8|nr:hypothetical protein [Azospirillum sp.]HYD69641.1 hypothetical protein [Azospirillum sp.]